MLVLIDDRQRAEPRNNLPETSLALLATCESCRSRSRTTTSPFWMPRVVQLSSPWLVADPGMLITIVLSVGNFTRSNSTWSQRVLIAPDGPILCKRRQRPLREPYAPAPERHQRSCSSPLRLEYQTLHQDRLSSLAPKRCGMLVYLNYRPVFLSSLMHPLFGDPSTARACIDHDP